MDVRVQVQSFKLFQLPNRVALFVSVFRHTRYSIQRYQRRKTIGKLSKKRHTRRPFNTLTLRVRSAFNYNLLDLSGGGLSG